VRALASKLAINPNTIQRAYEALEQEGYLYTVAGKGSFAAPLSDIHADRRETLLSRFDEAVAELLFLGMSREELCTRIRAAAKKGEESHD
jgi:GntR family transcriptional regulator